MLEKNAMEVDIMNLRKVLFVAGKFAVGGILIMFLAILVKNRSDFLLFGIGLLVSFVLGGAIMFLSLLKDLSSLIKSNKLLTWKLERVQKQLSESNQENNELYEALTPEQLADIIEKIEKSA